jgi:hypothetical protein
LSRVVRATAKELDMPCIEFNSSKNSSQMILGADWMILSRNEALMAALAEHVEEPAEPPKPPVLWTDARSSLFEILQ